MQRKGYICSVLGGGEHGQMGQQDIKLNERGWKLTMTSILTMDLLLLPINKCSEILAVCSVLTHLSSIKKILTKMPIGMSKVPHQL